MQNDMEYDNILIIIYYVTKYTLFIPTCEASIAVKFTKLFFKHIKCCFEISRDIVTDRDSRIILKFWHEIYEIQIIKKCISIIYHPQINGQSEVLNYIMKDYLHIYNVKN